MTPTNAIKSQILYVSPEKLLSPGFQRFMRTLSYPISLACIDEAHCVSEWSHNFRCVVCACFVTAFGFLFLFSLLRSAAFLYWFLLASVLICLYCCLLPLCSCSPAYLRLNAVLRDTLRVPCILALTATATRATELSICASLGMDVHSALIRVAPYRANLHYTVHCDRAFDAEGGTGMSPSRELALFNLLHTEQFKHLQSIIVYVMLQRQADALAQALQVKGFQAQSYHAGKTAKQRARIQHLFMTNKLRIVVATIAFGMGLDKQVMSGQCGCEYRLH